MQQEYYLLGRRSGARFLACAIDDLGQRHFDLAFVEGHLLVATISSCRYGARMSFTKIDHWVGKTLFVPPIIKLCQLTRQSQFAVSRLFWFIAALDGFYRADTLFGSILWGGLSALMMFSAAQRADSPATSFMFFRLLAVLMLVIDLVRGAAIGEWAGIEFWVFISVAEYAAIIRTIPPKEAAKSAAKVPKPTS
jgi:hypothetical protein